jgi:class 3 adenylate cyclase/tetratricopeptide (TPR) repeat protein
MPICSSCGTDNAGSLKFCGECGSRLTTGAPREVRKTVTVLFADLAGSTAIAERLDPESMRNLMSSYFGEMKGAIEAHGGTVEKFIGDAVMAVFGIPVLHEDDALRAVRAAVEMRGRMAELAANARDRHGIDVSFRTGLHTGEVVAGAPDAGTTLVTGDTVNTAARLEQAAAPGEILLGLNTYRLVRDAVVVESVGAVEAKGKSGGLDAFRLIEVHRYIPGRSRRLDAPLVGREGELKMIHSAFTRAAAERLPQLVTVRGSAGLGKSRLVGEFLDEVAPRATVLNGRCLPYGDGITYWPLREIVHSAAEISEKDRPEAARLKLLTMLGSSPEADMISRLVGAAVGLESEAAAQDEIFWATRRLFERLAGERPLVVVIEDIHWAEPTLLDLIEYVIEHTTDSPLLVLCPTRPELEERRPAWGADRPNATSVQLEPLGPATAEHLLVALPGGAALPASLRARVLAAAEGNPLFVEEMIGMLVDKGLLVEHDGRWAATGDIEQTRVPASVRALIAARIDGLPLPERDVAERASVVGREFDSAAVRELRADALTDVGQALDSLVRKELVRPERSPRMAGDAFKFRHLLIRDAAYESLPKSERAVLHERFAHWLERVAGDRASEYDEIVGYHLEQAAGYLAQLGDSERARELARGAGGHLYLAGRRAARRTDNGAVIPLMRKVAELLPPAERTDAELELAAALNGAGETDEASRLLQRVVDEARREGDGDTFVRARVHQVIAGLGLPEFQPAAVREELTGAISVLEGNDRYAELSYAWLGLGLIEAGNSEYEKEAFERALHYATMADETRIASAAIANLADRLRLGPEPVGSVLPLIEEYAAGGVGGRRAATGLKAIKAGLLGMHGEFDEARTLFRDALEVTVEMQSLNWEILIRGQYAALELLAGDPEAAHAVNRAAKPSTMIMDPMRAQIAANEVLVLCALGRFDEALKGARLIEDSAESESDIVSTGLRAKSMALAHKGDIDGARNAIDAAVTSLESNSRLGSLGFALMERSSLRRQSQDPDWRDDLEEAASVFRRKDHLVGLAKAQEALAAAPSAASKFV